MNLQELDKYLNDKIDENENFIIFTFYELRVKSNLSEQETEAFLKLASIRLSNLKYEIYYTGDEYIYNGKSNIVQDNELMIALKR